MKAVQSLLMTLHKNQTKNNKLSSRKLEHIRTVAATLIVMWMTWKKTERTD